MPVKSVLFLLLLLGISLGAVAFSANAPGLVIRGKYVPISPPVERTEPDPMFIQYQLGPGTAFQVLLQTPLDTSLSQVNDPVEAIMNQTLYLGTERMLEKDTKFRGSISRLEPPLQGRNAILAVEFTEIILPNGEKLPMKAHVRTERADHTWGGQITPGTKPLRSVQHVWGIGDYNRTIWAGPRMMGDHVTIPPGEHWTIILDEPLVLLKSKEED